jgi:hypothetical protein
MAASAQASLLGYSDRASFDTAISAMSTQTVSNFDGIASGTTFAPGTGASGSGFTLTLGGGSAGSNRPSIGTQFWTTSGSQYLGLDNPDTALEAGDTLTFSFDSAQQAFGLYFIGGSDVLGGDIRLSANSGANIVTNSAIYDLTDGSGSFAYFLGFASNDSSTFSSVTLDYAVLGLGDLLPIAIDDVVLARSSGNPDPDPNRVPEPGTLALMLSGLALIAKRKSLNKF